MNWREWFILFFLTGVNCFDCPQPYVPIDAENVCIYMSSRPVALNEMEGYCSSEANGGKPFNRRFSDKGIRELARNLKLSVESIFPPEVYIENTKHRKQEKQHLHELATQTDSKSLIITVTAAFNIARRLSARTADKTPKRSRRRSYSKGFPKTFKVVHSSQQLRIFIVFPTVRTHGNLFRNPDIGSYER
ncbi:hypothetical protein AVEN_106260-1 [Araneus ventricosus]|uniref:Uncharacterized protein n=1 Tax=Araneus ventricosus TaxID=182803 RepID=A0A4Y2X4T0_ARAVE|nr:hypothetical protein AVEN_85748-1 [Araneus ventricosus]GBO44188.1 hypothetical protein AVEN_106260-1 [Araneus ventricosus]